MLIDSYQKGAQVLKMLDISGLETRPLINIGKKTCLKIVVSSYVGKQGCQKLQSRKKERKKENEQGQNILCP